MLDFLRGPGGWLVSVIFAWIGGYAFSRSGDEKRTQKLLYFVNVGDNPGDDDKNYGEPVNKLP